MKKINKEQSEWLKKNFGLSKRDLPTDFYNPSELAEILCGTGLFRDKTHQGDSMSFIEDCLISLFLTTENKKKFELLFSQLHNHWIAESKKLEYYELLSNLNEMNEHFVEFVKQANDQQIDYEVRSMLYELKIVLE